MGDGVQELEDVYTQIYFSSNKNMGISVLTLARSGMANPILSYHLTTDIYVYDNGILEHAYSLPQILQLESCNFYMTNVASFVLVRNRKDG